MDADQHKPIGMLDSGLGGLTVLRTVRDHLPHEDVIYYADMKHSPYGGRKKHELVVIIERAVDELLGQGIKALVLASNTGTSAGVERLRERLKIPVVGLEPALKPAIALANQGMILVLATQLTLREEKFNHLYEQYKNKAAIHLKSCPGLVELIDNGHSEEPALDDYLATLFRDLPAGPIATVVLGCTHYVIVKDAILRHLPGVKNCLDGNDGVARQIHSVLSREHLLNTGTTQGKIQFMNSNPDKLAFLEQSFQKLLKRQGHTR